MGNASLPDVILSLVADLARGGFWKRQDAELTVAWLQDLISVGYQFPELKKTASLEAVGAVESEIRNMPAPFLTVPRVTPAPVRGREDERLVVISLVPKKYDIEQCRAPVVRVQGSVPHRMAEFEKGQVRSLREKFANVVLIINYNFPLFRRSVHYWRAIYSRVFEIIEVVSGEEGDAALNVTGVRPVRKSRGNAIQKLCILHP